MGGPGQVGRETASARTKVRPGRGHLVTDFVYRGRVTPGARREVLISAIVVELAPDIGESLASAAGRMHLEKLGLMGPFIEGPDIDRVLAALEPGLRVFVGKRNTEQTIARIRARVLPDGGKP